MDQAQLFFGTGNPKKLEEIHGILGNRFHIVSFRDLPEKIEVVEDAPNLEGNAIKKAKEYFAATGIPCFADDTGLEIEALEGRPGVHSAYYAGEYGNAEANMNLVLKELEGIDERQARFRTVIAYYDGKALHTFEGILPGEIARAKRGDGGFGYDPIFYPEDSVRSLAEYSPEEKNAISHRGRAVRKFADFIL